MGDRAVAELAIEAVNMAVWNRRPHPGLIHHSDHGAQCTSLAFGRTTAGVRYPRIHGLRWRCLGQRCS